MRAAFVLQLDQHWLIVTKYRYQSGPCSHQTVAPVSLLLFFTILQRLRIQAETRIDQKNFAVDQAHLDRLHTCGKQTACGFACIGGNAVRTTEVVERSLWNHAEVAVAAQRELRYRISTIGRDSLWPETERRVLADARLVPLWTTLESAGRAPGAKA